MVRALVLLTLAVAPAAGCASAQAKAPVDRPALEVPPVPPRVAEPLPPPPPEPVPPLPESSAGGSSTSQQSTTQKPRQNREPGRDAVKPPESKPEPPPATEPPPPPASAPVVPPLRTPDTPAASDAASRVAREAIDRVRKTLNSTDYNLLKPELKKEYENAKQFLLQAEDAVAKTNYELARSLTDKAERIAKQLQGR